MESISNMKRTGANVIPSQVGTQFCIFSLIKKNSFAPRHSSNMFGATLGLSSFLRSSFFILMFALVLSGCTKDEDLDNVKPDSFNGTVTAKVENGSSYNSQISIVWALFDATVTSAGQLNGRMVGNGSYANGGFTINMEAIPSTFLMNIRTFFSSSEGLGISEELDYSYADARMLDVDFFGITNEETYLDYFIYTKTGSKPVTCLFVYVDSDVNVKGKNVNVVFQKGWNRIYWTPADKKVTSKAPSGMKWYLSIDAK